MSRYAAFMLCLSFGLVFQFSHGTEVTVMDKDDKLCLYADLMVNFSVSYEAVGGKNSTANFELPNQVTTNGSVCKTTRSVLKLNFGAGHSWTVAFTKKGSVYEADNITFSYNLSDSNYFNNSLSNETVSVTGKPQITNVGMDTCYSCKSKDLIQADSVNMTLWNVLMQAFVISGNKSENITSCSADQPSTTPPPTTHATSTTTAAPPPTTTPTPTLPTPTTGQYSVKPEVNRTACLLAKFGLRIGFKQGEKYEEMNIEPSVTNASGSCGVNSSELVLTSNKTTIVFTFASDTKIFHLHALNFTTNSGEVFSEANTSLGLWEAAVGSSYMCNKEQNYTITSLLTIYTFNLQVQPFEVKKDAFSTAEECQADAESFLVPIAVGVALLVLIVIVLLAYFIGRKRNMATGYESF
ncbi:lysosome-associated membrane glycoprotein 2 isoform X1 [Mastacembelus armatus]|uniref:Lysosomal-associated membrane protein 2 n=1 Tax=Mastacembelus armatus TaxID=205130 RepID=A0A3Q3SSK7_9TELE|nr:lysosome-associated membrane glycoprotein 2 isoform X1 [Mastacembelus armatus]